MHPFFWVIVIWALLIILIWPISYYAEAAWGRLRQRWRRWRARRAVLADPFAVDPDWSDDRAAA